ncbi:MAG TPA: noncanonical pyrimidine nucleotidase, YjjG family [Epulopiscium sp.]|nr:noncanonical pyrimidine nucleotidase, YjjG family [Candidatus Epulonipiscium sp.]
MIKAIFFDLDNTLWDHDKAQRRTIERVYEYLIQLHPIPDDQDTFARIYDGCNAKVWDAYKKGELKHEEVRINRFIDLLGRYNIADRDLAITLNELYLSIYPTWTFLVEGAKELLDELTERYPLGIITNGFSETQVMKIDRSGLKQYFKWIAYSGEVGKAKPHPEIFAYAMNQAHILHEEALFIGDDFGADIIGAKDAGMKTIWFNPKGKEEPEKDQYADYTVSSLKEISDIVKSLESC